MESPKKTNVSMLRTSNQGSEIGSDANRDVSLLVMVVPLSVVFEVVNIVVVVPVCISTPLFQIQNPRGIRRTHPRTPSIRKSVRSSASAMSSKHRNPQNARNSIGMI